MTSISERRASSRAPASTPSSATSSTSSTSTSAPPAAPDEHVEDVDALPPRDADGFARSARPDRSVPVSGSLGDDKMLDGEPLVSPYAENGPPENFAEVYAVYRRDPQWLNEHHPKAAHWMRKHYP